MSQLYFSPQPWMTTDAVARVLAALGAPQVDVRFVGGCVRNAVIGQAIADVDIATPEIPARVMERLVAAKLKVIPTGIDHGTVTAIVDGQSFEITTLRRDTSCDGRHAAVEFTTDWHEDSCRRDFTMNALSLRADGALFDDHGGIDDAKAGRVRFVGNPADRIQEDYLRILRLFRFFAWYGRVPLDAMTREACGVHAPGMTRLSAERIQRELAKILAAPDPSAAVTLMRETGALAQVLPEASDGAALAALISVEREAQAFSSHWLRRLAVLLSAQAVKDVSARLKLSNADSDQLAQLTAGEPEIHSQMSPSEFRRVLYRLGPTAAVDRLLLAWGRQPENVRRDDAGHWRELIAVADAWVPKSLPLSGSDVLALDVAPGPAVGKILAAVEKWWIAGDFAPTRAAALAELARRVAQKK